MLSIGSNLEVHREPPLALHHSFSLHGPPGFHIRRKLLTALRCDSGNSCWCTSWVVLARVCRMIPWASFTSTPAYCSQGRAGSADHLPVHPAEVQLASRRLDVTSEDIVVPHRRSLGDHEALGRFDRQADEHPVNSGTHKRSRRFLGHSGDETENGRIRSRRKGRG